MRKRSGYASPALVLLIRDAEPQSVAADFFVESEKEEEDREEIARVAFLMIKDGDVIMLTNGAIALRIARKLAERGNVTVLTKQITALLKAEANGMHFGRAGTRHKLALAVGAERHSK